MTCGPASWLACWLLGATLCSSSQAAGPAPSSPTAGWAKVDITPPLGIALGGRGGPEPLADTVLDPLCAQVLYLKDPKGTGFVLVSFDLVGLPHELSDRIRTALVQELGVPWDLVVLNASHTHSGPYMLRDLIAGLGPPPPVEVDYFRTLQEKVLSAARLAAKGLKPVTVTVHHGNSQLGINRRGRFDYGRSGLFAPNARAPFDDKVWVLELSPKNGEAPAVVFSYACHPVLVYGYATNAISADFPGVARNRVSEALGPGAHLQFVQGFAGDVRPRVVADLKQHCFRAPGPEDLAAAGKDLADAVLAALKTTTAPLALDIAAAADHPFLPRATPPPRQRYEQIRAAALTKTNAFRLAVSEYWLQRYDSGQGFARGDIWPLGLIRLAPNQWIVHSCGEPVAEWRGKITQWLAPLELVTWGYCQEARSYLPTEAMLPEGGYEVIESNEARASTPAPFALGIETVVRESLLRQLAFIQAKASPSRREARQ